MPLSKAGYPAALILRCAADAPEARNHVRMKRDNSSVDAFCCLLYLLRQI